MEILKSKKFLIAGAATVVVVLGIVGFFFLNREETYRIVKVFEVAGTANVNRETAGDLSPYVNMVLASGDHVTLEEGDLTLKADEDKFIYLEEHTELILEATGTAENSKTRIELLRGAINNEIQNKLIGDSSYEINTPNSTMSVRGTIFYVRVYEVDGVKYTNVVVFDGEVTTRLIYKDGTVSDKEVSVQKGSEVTIYEDDKETDYVSGPVPIDYDKLPDTVLRDLLNMIENGSDISISGDEIGGIFEKRENEESQEESLDDEDGDEDQEDASGDDASDPSSEESQDASDPSQTEGQDPSDQTPAGDSQESSSKQEDQEPADNNEQPPASSDQPATETFTVTFMYDGQEFGTQTVEKGQKASEPSLAPAEEGEWDYDFDKAVEKDITIKWKE